VTTLITAAACSSSSSGSGDSGFGSDASTGGLDGAGDAQFGDAITLPPSDGAAGDGAACTMLNIGILGNPGSNPSSNFQTWLISAGTSVQRIQTTATDTLTLAELQAFDVVVLDQLTREYTTAEATTFAQWVTAGGGVASMTGYNDTPTDFYANTLLAPLEVAYSGTLISGPVTTFDVHPITVGLTSVTFDGGYGISDLGGTVSTRTPLASIGSQTVAYAIQMGSGRAFVWGDEWIEYDSEWSTMPEIEQLWVNVFTWVSPHDKCQLMPPP
jgi:spore coat protein U-like protein